MPAAATFLPICCAGGIKRSAGSEATEGVWIRNAGVILIKLFIKVENCAYFSEKSKFPENVSVSENSGSGRGKSAGEERENKKAAARMGSGWKYTLYPVINYSRVAKCLMVRHI